jgi:salicylate hydroxylase
MAMILSNAGFAGIGAPGVEEELRKYYDGPVPPAGSIPWSAEGREVFFGYDAINEAKKLLSEV